MFHQYRFIVVIALLCIAAALATEKGKLPLALRGLKRTLQRDAGVEESASARPRQKVSVGRRLLAFALVLAAFLVVVLF